MDVKIYINDEKVSIDKPVEKEILLEYPLSLRQARTDLDCSLEYIPARFSVRTMDVLGKAEILTYRDLTSYTASQLLRMKNLGRKTLTEVQERLRLVGLELKAE